MIMAEKKGFKFPQHIDRQTIPMLFCYYKIKLISKRIQEMGVHPPILCSFDKMTMNFSP